MTLVRGYGILADMAPWPVDMYGCSTRDVILGLASQLPDLRKALVEGSWHVLRDGLCLDSDMLDLPAGKEVNLVPESFGSGGGSASTYGIIGLGAVLIGASLFVPGSTALLAGGYSAGFATAAGYASTVAFGVGLSLTLAGVSALLTPDPPEQDTSKGSTLMGGVVNNTSSDACVPVCFGRVLVGSIVTSFGTSTTQLL
jgi:predicted phage tail protein